MLALKKILDDNGISQAKLARLVGISPASMSQIISKNRWPKTPSPEAIRLTIVNCLAANDVSQIDLSTVFEVLPEPGMAQTAITTSHSEEDINMLLRKQTLTPPARKQFGLFRDPFDNDVQEPDDVFLTPDIRYVREYLWTTAKLGGFIAIVGESGAGKSTLRKDLEERINREDASIVVMSPYVLGMEDNDVRGKTLKAGAIADAMIYTIAPNEKPKTTLEAKGRQLHRLLKDSRRAGRSHVLVIEEAHGLAVPTLKHLKRFFELEDGFKKLLSIVLIGQSELKTKLSEHSPEVREVVQRCEVVELPPLDSQLEAYLRFKFDRVGKAMDDIFDKDAFDAIRGRLIFAKSSKSSRETVSLMYPLMINNLVTAALNSAAALGFDKISADLIREA
jgi:type II secretory pathway predicted ATPase ExeA